MFGEDDPRACILVEVDAPAPQAFAVTLRRLGICAAQPHEVPAWKDVLGQIEHLLACARGRRPSRSTPVAVRSPWVIIIGLIVNGATPVTWTVFEQTFVRSGQSAWGEGMHGYSTLIPSTSFMTSRYSWKSTEYLRTSTWALTPKNLLPKLCWNPPVTLITIESADTPRMTPSVANAVPTDTEARFFEPRYRKR